MREGATPAGSAGGSAQTLLREFCAGIAPRFRRAEPRQRVYEYASGLLAVRDRGNNRRLADLAGEARADGMQRLLTAARWDEHAVCEDLRRFVGERLPGSEGGVLTLVEEGFVRRGRQSVGLARQYRRAAARTENCQLGLFLAFAPPGGVGILVDRELYLPPSWTRSPERRRRGRVPDGLEHQPRQQLAARMFERTLAGPLPVRWVVSDLPYGADPQIRAVLEAHGTPYALGAEADEPLVFPAGGVPAPVVPSALAGAASWVRIPSRVPASSAMAYWLLARRSPADPAQRGYHLCHLARGSHLGEVISAVDPGPVDRGLRLARECAGLNRYEVQTWRAWYRHVTLSMAAQACLVLTAGQPIRPGRNGTSGTTGTTGTSVR